MPEFCRYKAFEMATNVVKPLAFILAFAIVAYGMEEEPVRKERSVDNRNTAELVSYDESRNGSNTINTLEYSIKLTMVNYGQTSAKVHQRFLFPDGAEVKSFFLGERNQNSRQRRSSENQRLTQWDGGSVNLNAASEKDADMVYVNHPTRVLDSNSKTFHRLSTSLTVTEGDVVGGEIFSPNYLSSYPNGADLTWLIAYPEGNVVRLEMEDFSMEECCDHLIVYDGFNKSHSVLATYDGEYQPSSDNVVVSTKQAMFLRFTSDCLVTSRGFRAKYVNVLRATTITTTPSAAMSCGPVTVTDSNSGNIYSPNYPGTYDPNMNCTWSVQTYHGTRVRFVLYNFSISYDDDVMIYDGTPSNQGSRLAQLTGSYYSGYTIDTNSNRAFVVFTSGDSTNYYNKFIISYTGFVSTPETPVETTPIYYDPPTCSGSPSHLSVNSSESLTSPGYNMPRNYPDNADCIWYVSSSSLPCLRFRTIYFSTEYNYDYVKIFNGHTTNDNYRIFRASGYVDPYTDIAFVYGSAATLTFTSDGSIVDTGFIIQVESADEPPTAEPQVENTTSSEITCDPSYVSGSYGYIHSPNYPSDYYNNTSCTTYISTPFGTFVSLSVQSFNLASGDYVKVYDMYSETLYGTYSGYLRYSERCYYPTRYLRVDFHSDSYYTSSGYELRYDYYHDDTVQSTSTPSGCVEQVPNNYGTIYSPNYPFNYDNSLHCQWTIEVYSNMYVLFTFNYFNLESCCDYISIYKGTPEASQGKVAQFSEPISPGFEFLVSDYRAYLTFYSDSTDTERGFNISYSAVSTSYVPRNDSGANYSLEESSYDTGSNARGEAAREVNVPMTGVRNLGKDLWAGSKYRPRVYKEKEKQRSARMNGQVEEETVN